MSTHAFCTPLVQFLAEHLGEQYGRILELLSTCGRSFVGQNIACKPPQPSWPAGQLTFILSVARWVSSELEGGLTNTRTCSTTSSASTPDP